MDDDLYKGILKGLRQNPESDFNVTSQVRHGTRPGNVSGKATSGIIPF